MEQTKDQQQRLAQTALTFPPGLGHIPQIEDPNAFNAALLKAIGIF
jgi:pimeloyl-ACP methyl ester carboxylesterase